MFFLVMGKLHWRNTVFKLDILELRKSLHKFLDPRWKSGNQSRESLYDEMSEVLGKAAHISEMTEAEIKKIAEHYEEKDIGFPCKKCHYYGGHRHYLPLCKLQIERTFNDCRCFKPKRDLQLLP